MALAARSSSFITSCAPNSSASRAPQRVRRISMAGGGGGGQRRVVVVVRAALSEELNAFERHARAAQKYATGPVSRPADLAMHLKPAAERALLSSGGGGGSGSAAADLKAAVAALSASAAQQPHLYAYKLASDRTKRAAEASRVQWSEIL